MSSKNDLLVEEITLDCMEKLHDLGIYISNRSTSSVYLKFKDMSLRSLTIRDHPGKPGYKYKWNIIIGYRGPKVQIDGRIRRYYYSEKNLQEFYEDILRANNSIQIARLLHQPFPAY